MPYEIYWGSGSPNAWRALLALEFKGLDYQSRQLQMSEREHKTPEFLAMNPRGKVPVLKDGDTIVCESLAILAYLEAKHPEPPLFGSTPAETGNIWQRVCDFTSYAMEPMLSLTLIFFTGKAAGKTGEAKSLALDVHRELANIETALDGEEWIAGESPSAADVVVYPYVACLARALGMKEARPLALGFLPLDKNYANLAAWMARIEALPGFDRTYPPHWRN